MTSQLLGHPYNQPLSWLFSLNQAGEVSLTTTQVTRQEEYNVDRTHCSEGGF